MKSIFTNLGKLLLCGVVVAMVGCTDFKEDIRVVDEKVNTLVESTTSDKAALEQTIDALKKDVTDNYYTKQQIDAVQSAIEKSIADEVKDLEGKINEVNGAIVAATQQVTEAINGLDSKKADKTEVKAEIDAAKKAATDAIAAVTESLNKVKGELSADLKKVQDDLAKAKSDLEGKVGANTSAISALQSQVETLGAQMLEVYNMAMSMGIALQEDMNEIAADLGDEIDAVDAKAIELKNELLSLSDHLNEYEATTDLKLTELHGSLQALSTYLEEYEASIDAKFAEINNTFASLSLYLQENMVTGEEFAAKFAETDGAITALTNLLSDLEAKHDADLEAVYEEINSRFNTTNEALSATLLIIEDLAAELKAEDETIYRELNITKEMLTSVYNEQLVLAGEVSTIQETLEARKEAAEAFKAEYDKKIAELEAEDNANLTLIQSIGTALNSYVEDLTAEIDLVNLEFTKVREEMTQMMNLLSDEMAAADEEIWNEIAKNNETAQTAISALMNYINDHLKAEDENLWKEIYTLQEFATQNYQAIQQLQSTVETLVSIEDFLGWAAGHDETHQTLIGMIEGINTYIDEALTEITENAASDREQSQLVATALNNLIGDVAGDLAKLRAEFDNKMNHYDSFENDVANKLKGLDKVIENLENKLLDRIGAIEKNVADLVNRVQSLVYVPKYSDNLAYMEFAKFDMTVSKVDGAKNVYTPGYTYLTYKVNAKDAAAVAEGLATSWTTNPAIFDFDVTDVETRGASASGADLEICGVEADGQYITVKVLPVGFDDEKFWAEAYAQGKGDDDDGIYSASLVISDAEKSNFRATEYLNLVPELEKNVETFIPVLYPAGTERPTTVFFNNTVIGPAEATIPEAFQTEDTKNYYISANDFETAKTLVCPAFGFVDAAYNIHTPEALAEKGYTNSEVTKKVLYKGNDVLNAEGDTFVENNINFIKGTPNWSAKVNEEATWEDVGNNAILTYEYTWNGFSLSLGHMVEITNAQIYITVGDKTDETTGEVYTELPWTVALAETLYDGTDNFAKNLVIEDVPYTGVPDLKLALKNIVSTSMFTKVDGNWTAMGGSIIGLPSYGDGVVDVRLAGGKYSWNNEYKVVWTSTDNVQHIDATVTAIVKLTGKPEKIDVNIENVDYKLVKDTDYFQGAIDLEAASYAAIESYLGYADANAAKWTAEFAALRAAYDLGDFGTPFVNEDAGKSENLAGLDKAARLYPADDAINYGAANTTTLTVEPWFDVPVNFTVTGTANKPANALIFSEDHVEVKDAENGRVQVYGQIGEDGKYSIILSDLAKYFNVTEELQHNMKVVFEVEDPIIDAQVKVAPQFETPVIARTVGTYNYLEDKNAVLDWYEYNGTEVPVKATLIAEGLVELGHLHLVLWTKDPLDLLAKEGTADSEGRVILNVDRYPRTATIVPVYKNLVIRGLLEGPEVNLLDPEAASLANVFDKSNAPHTYGAKLDIEMAMQSVYYYKDDATTTPTYIDINKYTYDPVSGILVLKGDDGSLRRPIIADFNLKLSHRICDGLDKLVAVRVIFNHKSNIAEQETITAGTYGFDPTELIAEGYVAVKNGEVWHVVPEADVVPEGFDAAAKDGKELETAIKENKDVLLIDDAKIDTPAESNSYGKTGLNVNNGQTIDGNGNTLEVSGANGTWDSGISTTGGLIQNITIKGAFRGIFINHNSSHSEKVILKNVILDGVTYTISCDQGKNQDLEAYNSTFNGWTSYASTIGKVSFTDCYFGKGNGYAFCRPYAPTTFVGCEFEAGYQIDARATVTFEDCTLNGVALTTENLATLVTSNIANATVK